MLIIGITGSFGSGKTTVATLFARLGAKVLNADSIAHQLMKRHGPCYGPILRQWGPSILTNGHIDHRKLATYVFQRPHDLRRLTRIVHPEVKRVIQRRIQQWKRQRPDAMIVMDVPLLFESGLDRLSDITIVVKANLPLQLKRIQKRFAISKRQALKRTRAQMPIQDKLRLADFVIDNRTGLTNLKNQVKDLWLKLQQN